MFPDNSQLDPNRWRLDGAIHFFRGPFGPARSTDGLYMPEGWYGHGSGVPEVAVPSLAHYVFASMTQSRDDFFRVLGSPSPQVAGRMVGALGGEPVVEIRPDWPKVEFAVLRYANLRKCSMPYFRALLLGTRDRPLVWNAPWNPVWGGVAGSGMGGHNLLGRALMEVRAELRSR